MEKVAFRRLYFALAITILFGLINMPLGSIIADEFSPAPRNYVEHSVEDSDDLHNEKIFYLIADNKGFYPNEIITNRETLVRIYLTNEKGVNNLIIKDFNIRTKNLREGDTDSIEFIANRSGVFEFYSQFNQRNIKGKIIVN